MRSLCCALLGLSVLLSAAPTQAAAVDPKPRFIFATGALDESHQATTVADWYGNRLCQLVKHAARQDSRAVECRSYEVHSHLLQDIIAGKIAMAYVSSFDWYRLHREHQDLVPFLTMQYPSARRRGVFAQSAIVVKQSSTAQILSDLHHAKVGIRSSTSVASYIVPRLLLWPFRDATNRFVPTQTDQYLAEALMQNEVDAISINAAALSKPPLRGRIRVLAMLQGVPGDLLIVNRQLISQAAAKDLQKRFIKAQRRIKIGSGFVPPTVAYTHVVNTIFQVYCRQFSGACVR